MSDRRVTCRCTECDCERVVRDVDAAISSWLVCMSCCLGRHVFVSENWCESCDQRIAVRPG
jgi:hypothetical protein